LDFNYHKKGWFLEAALVYCEAITSFARDLNLVDVKSRGFLRFRQYVENYANSYRFLSLLTEAQEVKRELAGVKYRVLIKPGKFEVRKYEEEINYSSH
jgi:DNA mismatch repair protein MutS